MKTETNKAAATPSTQSGQESGGCDLVAGLTAEERAELRRVYMPEDTPSCPLCGAELVHDETFGVGGVVDVFSCPVALGVVHETPIGGKPPRDWQSHLRESITLRRNGNPAIIALLDAAERLPQVEVERDDWERRCWQVNEQKCEQVESLQDALLCAVDWMPLSLAKKFQADPAMAKITCDAFYDQKARTGR